MTRETIRVCLCIVFVLCTVIALIVLVCFDQLGFEFASLFDDFGNYDLLSSIPR